MPCTCSLTTAYQHGRYVPAHTSDAGKSAMTCRRATLLLSVGSSSVRQPALSDPFCPMREKQVLLPLTVERGIMTRLLPGTKDRVADLGL